MAHFEAMRGAHTITVIAPRSQIRGGIRDGGDGTDYTNGIVVEGKVIYDEPLF